MDAASIPATSGIYRIINTITGHFYIGSTVNLHSRWMHHLRELRRNDHGNPRLQYAWNKYGEQAFTFEVLELVLPVFRVEREQYWLDREKPFGKQGYNIALLARGRMGIEMSETTRQKLRESSSGRTHRPESIEKCRIAKLGHILSAEGRSKMIASKTGHTYTPEVYASRMKTLIVTSPDGTEYVVTGVRKFCKEHGLDVSSLMRAAKGSDRGTACTQHKGYRARFLGTELKEVEPRQISTEARSARAIAQKKTLIVTGPDGTEYMVHGISQFAKEHNLDRYHLVEIAQGKRSRHKGWTARYP